MKSRSTKRSGLKYHRRCPRDTVYSLQEVSCTATTTSGCLFVHCYFSTYSNIHSRIEQLSIDSEEPGGRCCRIRKSTRPSWRKGGNSSHSKSNRSKRSIVNICFVTFTQLGLVGSSGGYTYYMYTSHASPRACGARLGRIMQERPCAILTL